MSNLRQLGHGTGSVTLASPCQLDSAIIVVYASNQSGTSFTAPTDDVGNTYQEVSGTLISPNDDGSGWIDIWYAPATLFPNASGAQVITGHIDPFGDPTPPYMWVYEVLTNQIPSSSSASCSAPIDISSINFDPGSTTPNIPTPGFTGLVGSNSTNPASLGDFCVAVALVGPGVGTITSVDSPWTLDAVQGGNAAAHCFLLNGVDMPVTFHQASSIKWAVAVAGFTADEGSTTPPTPPSNTANVDPWIVDIQDQKLSISDLDGSSDLSDLVFNIQDFDQLITADLANYILEGKQVMLLAGYEGMDPADYLQMATLTIDRVESDNGNIEYKFTASDANLKKLTGVVYETGDDGFATDSSHPRTVNGHPLDILVSVLQQRGVPDVSIDTDKIHYYRDFIFSGRQFLFELTSAPTAKDFIENELMKPLGMYLWPNNLGKLTVNAFYPALFSFGSYTAAVPPVFTLDTANTISVPLEQEAELINQVDFRFDDDGNDFLAEEIIDYDASISKYGLTGQHIVESKGLRSAFQGFLLSQIIGRLIALRYGNKQLVLDPVACFWSACILEPGDIIAVTNPYLPDRKFGVLGLDTKLFEVMDRNWKFLSGQAEIKLLEIDLAKFKQYLITANGEGDFTTVSAAHQDTYMYQSGADGLYSNGAPGNTLG